MKINPPRMYLSYNNNEESFEIPIVPPTFEIDVNSNNSTAHTIGKGEITIIKPYNQSVFSIKSFFPTAKHILLNVQDFKPPHEYITIVERWRKTQKPLRFVLLRPVLKKEHTYKINMAVSIEKFHWEDPNQLGDINYELSLKEFRFYKFNQNVIDTNLDKLRPNEQNIPAEYTISEGETLESICIKFFGSDDWKLLVELKRLNGFTDYDVIKKTYIGKKIKLFTTEISI